MSDQLVGTFTGTLSTLALKGINYATVFDLGCADGHFFLAHYSMGLFRTSVCVNIDANPIYESSLKFIQEVIGGHYLIGAVTDKVGEAEMNTSAHHYWGSLLPDDDTYWKRLHDLRGEKIKVPTTTLDAVADRFDLKPPFLIKLDLQGCEIAALRGATKVLSQTNVIICETAIDEFSPIDEFLVKSGFGLFDLTMLNRFSDSTLGWFYPVYLNRRLDHIKQLLPWDRSLNDQIVQAQAARRNQILTHSAAMLDQLR